MKKILFAVMMVVLAFTVCACRRVGNRIVGGKDIQTFNYAYIRLGDKEIVEGRVAQWRDYDDSGAVQVMINGKYYLTHYSCVVLVADESYMPFDYGNGDRFN